MSEVITKIRKRSGDIAPFSEEKILKAIINAAKAVEESDEAEEKKLASEVVKRINKKFHPNSIPAVEEIQDVVEEVLIENKIRIIDDEYAKDAIIILISYIDLCSNKQVIKEANRL